MKLIKSFFNVLFRRKDDLIKFNNVFTVEHIRDGEVLSKEDFHNAVTTEGKNQLLDIMFRAQTQLTAWALGLIDNSGFSALAAGDTMASHTGWTEFTNYSQANRVAWTQSAAAAGSITNTTAATIDITGTGTLYGVFIASNNTISGTTGKLWATAAFNTTKPVVNGDQIKLTYTVSVS
jgi:hypothetical protein